eukprot:g46952.t1
MGLDGIPGRALRSCVGQLAEVFTDIFNLSLLQIKLSTFFKKTTIIPVPEKAHAMFLNDYRSVALTSIIMKCFKRLVMALIKSSLPACLNPLQFAYQLSRKKGGEHAPIYSNGAEVESVENIKFLGLTITDNLSWASHIDVPCKKAPQHLFFLRWLRKFGKSLITEANLASMDSIYTSHCRRKVAIIIKTPPIPTNQMIRGIIKDEFVECIRIVSASKVPFCLGLQNLQHCAQSERRTGRRNIPRAQSLTDNFKEQEKIDHDVANVFFIAVGDVLITL